MADRLIEGQAMATVTLTEAKAQLSALVERAARDETVRITRRAKAMAQITRLERERKSVDIEALQNLTASMPQQPSSAGEWVRSARDQDRY